MAQYRKRRSGGRDRRGHAGGHDPQARSQGGFKGGSHGGGKDGPPPSFIPSPYNFAPISDRVCEIPAGEASWADVPFSDGLSGHIQLRVTAKTPIFIRGPGKHPKEADEKRRSDPHQKFYRLPDGRFAIPGTSIKGMLRNVLEIATFSRMTHVDDKRHGFRDLNNSDPQFYRGWMSGTEPKSAAYRPKARAGWLSRGANGEWLLQPCEFARVDHSLLEAVSPSTSFSQKQQARYRYKAWCDVGKKSLDVMFDADPAQAHTDHSCGALWYAKVTSLRGSRQGTLVFTGQPMDRDRDGLRVRKRKHMEFVFFDDPGAAYPTGPHPVPEEVMEDFKFIHEDSEDWKWWNRRLRTREVDRVPVFYLAFDKRKKPAADDETVSFGPDTEMHSMGLALMYRLAHHKTICDALPEAHRQATAGAMPIAEAIFGRVDGREALRGRIAAEPFPALGEPRVLDMREEVLNRPKPTFYPNYIQQETDASGDHLASDRYATLQGQDARIRGWKRYPVPKDGPGSRDNPRPNDNRSVCTYFQPIENGTQFEGYLRFHNLRPWELGALIWAITFGDAANREYRHSLGMAKPLGYGAVRIEIQAASVIDPLKRSVAYAPDEWLGAFRVKMAELCCHGWEDEPSIRELRLMAGQDADPNPARMKYPRHVRDFAEFKKTTPPLVLPPYSKIVAKGGAAPNSPGASRPGQVKTSRTGGGTPQQSSASDEIRVGSAQKFSLLGRSKNGNPKFQLEGGGPRDIGYLQDPKDRERFPANAEPGKWVGEFVVKSKNPGNWCLTWPPGKAGDAPKP